MKNSNAGTLKFYTKKQKEPHIRNFSVAVVRCRRSVYCIGQADEEFPACYAKVRVQGTFSEVCARKPAALLCIHSHIVHLRSLSLAKLPPNSTKKKNKKGSREIKHSP